MQGNTPDGWHTSKVLIIILGTTALTLLQPCLQKTMADACLVNFKLSSDPRVASLNVQAAFKYIKEEEGACKSIPAAQPWSCLLRLSDPAACRADTSMCDSIIYRIRVPPVSLADGLHVT